MSRHRARKDSITAEIMLNCLLRWSGGGSYLDIRLSKAAFYSYIYKCMDEILDAEALVYKFPRTTKELDEATLQVCHKHVGKLFMCITRLHNSVLMRVVFV